MARRFLFKKKGSTIIASSAVAATIFLSIFTGVIFTGVKLGVIDQIADYQVGHVLISNDKGLISTQETHRISLVTRTNPMVVGGTSRITTSADLKFFGMEGVLEQSRISTFGVDPILEQKASRLSSVVSEGAFIQFQNEIVVGSEILTQAKAKIGSIVEVTVSGLGNDDVTKKFVVVGVSDLGGFSGFSQSAIIHIKTLREMMNLGTGESGSYLVRLSDISNAEEVAEWLKNRLVTSDSDDNTELRIEPIEVNTKSFATTFDQLIAFINLIGFVGMGAAALGIIVVLMMMVSGKTRDIGLLRAIGIKRGGIIVLFMLNGAIIGVIGAITGGVVGSIAIVYLHFYPVAFFGGIAPVVALDPTKLLQPMMLGFTISVLSSIYPAWRASRYRPAEAMRYF